MSLRLSCEDIVFSEFGNLEPAQESWREEADYWEDFNRRFFASNGRSYGPQDSNVAAWLGAPDRAPYAEMARLLLPRLQERLGPLDDIDFVLFAHWLPDLHLGTSVTNFALHHLGLEGAFGFALSDRGRSAPLFALNCIDRYLQGPRRKALLMVMDQKHLLYRSELLERLDPVNCGAAMVLERDGARGKALRDYRRTAGVGIAGAGEVLAGLMRSWGCSAQGTTLIADPELLEQLRYTGPCLPNAARQLCAAPFAQLASGAARGDVVIAIHEQDCLSTIWLSAEETRAAA
ncbi:MAG: hypothetical protein AB7U46_09495 [Paenirhodobacter sp.]|uniref:hypothetical protein n=1 Tax=Paenirhodobacter sp. TaxID=1965326 RepID=UPI003D12EA02